MPSEEPIRSIDTNVGAHAEDMQKVLAIVGAPQASIDGPAGRLDEKNRQSAPTTMCAKVIGTLRIRPPENRPWLSLAAIVGNEEHHIGRFLAAFEPLVDEIVLVRAIGALEPDRTLDIAQEFCSKPLTIAEFENGPQTKDWPHVDNFGAARQRAFDLARGQFVMWADCDDLISPEDIQKLRSRIDAGQFDVLFMHYRCVGAPPLMRERVVRKDLPGFCWMHAVHEAMHLPKKLVPKVCTDIEIFHFPIPNAKGEGKAQASLERNIRILEHVVGPAALSYFYLHRDYLLRGEANLAIEWGKMAIATKELTNAERYRVFYNMAMIYMRAGDFGQAEQFLLNGLRLDYGRRECLCLMAQSYVARKDWHRALTWIQAAKCIAAPPMKQRPNWFEESWYGWQGDTLHAFILRKLGAEKEALQVEASEHDGTPMISLLHATRGRHEKAIAARDHWLRHALKPGMIEHIFAVDEDDKESLEELHGFRVVVVPAGGGCVRAWNAAAAASKGRLLIQMSDDWTVPHQWDNALVWRMQTPLEKRLPKVLAISDGFRQDKLMCMAICTREYYKKQRHEQTGENYLFHPDYLGVYSDDEFTVRAYENGAVIEAKDIVFSHEHPVFGRAEMDPTYQAQNSRERYEHGIQVFNRRNPRHKRELPPSP